MTAPTENKRFPECERRLRLLAYAVMACCLILVGKLWYLQVIRGEEHAERARDNRLHRQWLKAPRGMVFGRDKRVVLADTEPARDLVVVPALCDDREQEVTRRLEGLLGVDGEAILENIILERKRERPYMHVMVKRNITMSELMRVEEYSPALPGVRTIVRPQRRYLYGDTAGQVLGYVGEISGGQLETKGEDSGYKSGDLIGQDGLERYYEDLLRGIDGQLCVNRYAGPEPVLRYDGLHNEYVVVDVEGRRLREELQYRVEPTPGKPLHVTLDMNLQLEAERLLKGEIGAIVVLNADTGEVLALASSPSYNPNVFVSGRSAERTQALTDPAKPMLSRAYRQHYPPGSVFKVALAMAALEEGIIDKHTRFTCTGLFRLNPGGRAWRCWRLNFDGSGHGSVDVVDALAYSCDCFFYNVGHLLEVDRIDKWSKRLGLGVKSGIDLPHEEKGLVPSREWKQAAYKNLVPDDPSEWNWYPGDTINLSIGQGSMAVTPLQAAVLMASVVNGGRRVRPYINLLREPDVTEPLVSAETLAIVHEGMRKCVEKEEVPSGTGRRAKVPGIVILGKTGTAQCVAMKHYEGMDEEDIPYELRDHAWFVAGVLDQEPRIAISVLIEHGLHGSSAAAPLAGHLIEHYYGRQSEPERRVREARAR